MDTIYALASAQGKAGVAVVRLSGALAFRVVEDLTGQLPEVRQLSLRRIRWAGETLDEALVAIFASGASFTGEEAAELHLHGSTAVVKSVLQALSEQPGLRHAMPGEFTRRALENGKLDLAQVEGLADLIDAETESQRRQAFWVLSGAIGERAEKWRRDLIRAAALLEATIDFVDEDVPVDVKPEVSGLLNSLLHSLRKEADGARAAERIRDGFEVAIVGAPNVGKSTLLNALAGRDAAITSEIAGTTRDVIEVRMDLSGLAVTLLDTAGLRETLDQVEAIGISRALQRASDADLRVFLTEDGQPLPGLTPVAGDIVAIAKADQNQGAGLRISGKTGEGLDKLVHEISARLSEQSSAAGTVTRERHRIAVLKAIKAIESASNQISSESSHIELAAEDLQHAIRALDSLVGRLDVEDLLDEIFSSFCIGK